MIFHPLCGYSLQKGTRIFAIVDLVTCIGLTFLQLIFLHFEKPERELLVNDGSIHQTSSENGVEESWKEYIVLLVFSYVLFVVYALIEIWMYRLLTRASVCRDLDATRRWLLIRVIITGIILVLNILSFTFFGYSAAELVFELGIFLYKLFELVVVYSFKRELEEEHK
ncbi:unnamed protein product [Orchesella dallaii]|uniref:Uncharacterized protein n=1 Tax=Orchesella dallaii TaxID=48710 RepID=A0ABP1S7D9_9HEXA